MGSPFRVSEVTDNATTSRWSSTVPQLSTCNQLQLPMSRSQHHDQSFGPFKGETDTVLKQICRGKNDTCTDLYEKLQSKVVSNKHENCLPIQLCNGLSFQTKKNESIKLIEKTMVKVEKA